MTMSIGLLTNLIPQTGAAATDIPWAALTGGGAAGAVLIALWIFVKFFERSLERFDTALKAQRDECNADRTADRADRAQERTDFLHTMDQMRQSIDVLTQRIAKP